MVAQRAKAEEFQYGDRADKIDECIKQSDIEEFGAAIEKAVNRDEQYGDGADRIDRQYAIERGWAYGGAGNRHGGGDAEREKGSGNTLIIATAPPIR